MSPRGIAREAVSTLIVALIATGAMFVLLNALPPDRNVAESNEPLMSGLLRWWARALSGDFGESLYASRSVLGIVSAALPKTLLLLGAGLVTSFSFYVLLGWRMAISPHPAVAGARDTLATLSLVPNFLLAFLIRPYFVRLDPTPLTWTITVVSVAVLLVMSNGLLLETQRTLSTVLSAESARPYVQSLRARRLAVGPAMLRNAAGVLLSTWASHLPRMITALFILEWAFNVHGLGYEGLSAFHVDGRRDKPVILAVTLLSVLLVRGLVIGLRLGARWLQPASTRRAVA